MPGWVQDLVVTLVAAVAAVIVLKRVLGFARPQRPAPKCAACETSAVTPGTVAGAATGGSAPRG
jgi:hypothetical protein